MRIFTQNRRAGDEEVHVRAIDAYACGGKTMTLFPELLLPSSKSASGVLSTIPMHKLFIEDLVSSGTFKTVIFSCDGTNANRAAIRMMTSELQKHGNLLIFTSICNSHAINNAAKWGLGNYPYGAMLRSSHVFDAARKRDIPLLVDRCLRDATPRAIIDGHLVQQDCTSVPVGVDSLYDVEMEKLRCRFIGFVTGQRGPYQNFGVNRKSDEIARVCMELSLLGAPGHYCSH